MSISSPSMQDLLSAGVHFGHQTRRGNPKMGEYIYGARDGVHIINLEHSEKLLKAACEYAYFLGEQGKTLLFVGTKKQAQPIIKELASEIGQPYADTRWFGGFLTNFDEMRKNIKKLLDLKDQQQKGQLTRYTKKEQLLIARKLEKFDMEMGGVSAQDKTPDALFIVDSVGERIALLEAIRVGLPVIAISDSNSDPSQVNYPIPGNDDASKSIRVITEAIAKSYAEGAKKFQGKKDAAAAEAAKAADAANDVTLPDEELLAAEELAEKQEIQSAKREVGDTKEDTK
jgi:small subunit ribosomal protein S2